MDRLRSGPSPTRRLRTLFSLPLIVLAVIVFLVEELLWGWLGRLTEVLGLFAPVIRIEAVIRGLPPYLAMLLFILPWLIILPVKLMALALIAMGKPLGGILLFALGELVGVGFLHRIYVLCRPALLRLVWFIRFEQAVLRLKGWVHDHLDRLEGWRMARRLVQLSWQWAKRSLGGKAPGGFGQRFEAAKRLVKTRFSRG